jgi:RND superfamily putative drug exporter
MLGTLAMAALSWPLAELPGRPAGATLVADGHGSRNRRCLALTEMGRAGYLFPIRVIIEAPEGEEMTRAARLRGIRALADSLLADPRVGQVRSILDAAPGNGVLSLSILLSNLDSARAEHPALDGFLSSEARLALVDVIPADSVSLTTSMALVASVRRLAGSGAVRQLADTRALVGGYTASAVDFRADLLADFPLLVTMVLLVTGVMLAIAFRSVLVPLKAIVMNLLSVVATFRGHRAGFSRGDRWSSVRTAWSHRGDLRGDPGAGLAVVSAQHGL